MLHLLVQGSKYLMILFFLIYLNASMYLNFRESKRNRNGFTISSEYFFF